MLQTFTIRVTYFILPILIVAFPADVILSRKLKTSKTAASGEYSTWNDLYNGKIGSEIVVYGSSRAVAHINPLIIGDSLKRSCYNLGIDGHNFWMQYFRHTELLKHNKAPTVIVLSLDPTSLTAKGGIFNSDQFLPYMLSNESIKTVTMSYKYFSAWDYHVPLVRFSGKDHLILHALKLIIRPQHDSLARQKGYFGQPLSWNTDLSDAHKMFSSYKVEIDTGAVSLFEKFLRECRDYGMKIIFVYTPQYIEGQQFIQNKESIMDIYRQLGSRHKIPFLDYSGDSICLSKKYFYNSSHLNKMGSVLFSRRLGHDLKPLIN